MPFRMPTSDISRAGHPRAAMSASPGPSAALQAAFDRAMAGSDWPRRACAATLVALVDADDWVPWLDQATALLDQAERYRVERQRRPGFRHGLCLAYALHRLFLGALMGAEPIAVALGRDGMGRPVIADSPLQTSLSHAAGHVAIAVSGVGPVGVDIEPVVRADSLPEIAERICHPAEANALAGLAGPDYAAALLELWVRKEALLKAVGTGLLCEMPTFAAAGPHPWPDLSTRMVPAGNAWKAAIATPCHAPVAWAWLRPRPGATAGFGY